jgi:hypothetical protein
VGPQPTGPRAPEGPEGVEVFGVESPDRPRGELRHALADPSVLARRAIELDEGGRDRAGVGREPVRRDRWEVAGLRRDVEPVEPR